MARSVSRLLLAVAGASLAGCGAGVGTSLTTAYALCYQTDPPPTSQDVDALVRVIRFARDDGYSAGEVLAQIAPGCEGEDSRCLQCLTALIDAVY